MKKVLPVLLVVGVIALIVFSALGGALADRLFVIKPLDMLAPRGSSWISPIVTPDSTGTDEQAVVDVADSASNSVVTISIKTKQSTMDPFFLSPFGVFDAPNPESLRQEDVQQDIGTGFVVDSAGLIVTNKHVVSNTTASYTVVMKDDTEHVVTKIYRDPTNDLAILKVDTQLVPLELGDSTSLKVGQSVIAIGTALGEFRHTVTTGVISGLGRGIEAGDAFSGFVERLDNVIQTDAAINPGNSGGPLLNSSGKVIGVNVAVAATAQNVGFAIPINVLKDTLNTFNTTGQFDRPFFGVRYRLLPKETALLNDVPEGAYVVEIIPGSSAAEADIQHGDIITKFDGKSVKDEQGYGLANLVSQKKIGDTIGIELWRNGEVKQLSVVLKAAE
jgi:serine protease Do